MASCRSVEEGYSVLDSLLMWQVWVVGLVVEAGVVGSTEDIVASVAVVVLVAVTVATVVVVAVGIVGFGVGSVAVVVQIHYWGTYNEAVHI